MFHFLFIPVAEDMLARVARLRRPAMALAGGAAAWWGACNWTQAEGVRFENVRRESKLIERNDRMKRMEELVLSVQDEICRALEEVDGKKFREDAWERPEGGGGRSRVLQDGNVFEKAGVNVSIVHGTLPKAAVQVMNSRGKDLQEDNLPFYACGISLVIHPRNPMAPTAHANFRMFEVRDTDPVTGKPRKRWWYGGGADLTPAYLFEEDAVHFHHELKHACDKHDKSYYPEFKAWCDEYFDNTHRGEKRGVGGIFYDDFGENTEIVGRPNPKAAKKDDEVFAFVRDAAHSFLPAYVPVVMKRKDMPFTEEQKRWQQLRRGRYVEFNLVHDRGTKFGLHTPHSRTESILVSLPLTARWEYMQEPEPGTPEAKLLDVLRKPRNWV